MIRLMLIVVLLSFISACSHAPARDRKTATQWETITPNAHMMHLAQFATNDLINDKVITVTNAKRQTVVGSCYLIDFLMSNGDTWQAELYKDPNGKLTLLERRQR